MIADIIKSMSLSAEPFRFVRESILSVIEERRHEGRRSEKNPPFARRRSALRLSYGGSPNNIGPAVARRAVCFGTRPAGLEPATPGLGNPKSQFWQASVFIGNS